MADTKNVSVFRSYIPLLKLYFCNLIEGFQGGQAGRYISTWAGLTTDHNILQMIKGVHIPLISKPMFCTTFQNPKRNILDSMLIQNELDALFKKGVIKASSHEPGEYISPIFLTQNKDGGHRLILNLKKFNDHVEYLHFKMTGINEITKLMRTNCFMASIDIKSAYYSIPIASRFQKYLKFEWGGALYQFVCMPNGLSCCPRMFTKLLKPVLASLREQGVIILVR